MTATFDIIGEVYFASYFQESDLASYVPRNGKSDLALFIVEDDYSS